MKYYMLLFFVTISSLLVTENCEAEELKAESNNTKQRDKEYYDAFIKPYGNNIFGHYNFEAKVYEHPSNEVLPIIDSKYFKYKVADFLTEVDNLPPSATYEISLNKEGKHKIDVIYLDGCNKTNASAWNKYKTDLVTMLNMPQHNLDVKTFNIKAHDGEIENKEELAWDYASASGTYYSIGRDYLTNWSQGPYRNGLASITANIAPIKSILQTQFDTMVANAEEGHTFRNRFEVRVFALNLIPAEGTEEERKAKFTGSYTGTFNGRTVVSKGENPNRGSVTENLGAVEGTYDKGIWNLKDSGVNYTSNTLNAAIGYQGGVGSTSMGLKMVYIMKVYEKWQEDHRINRDLDITLSNNDMKKIRQQLRTGSTRIYIYNGDILTNIKSEKSAAYIWNYFTVNEDSYLVSIAGNLEDLKELDKILVTPYDGPGSISVDKKKLNEEAEKQRVLNFILSKIPIRNKNTDWFLLDDEIVYKTDYDDIEHDVPLNFLSPKEVYEISVDNKLAVMWGIATQVLYKQDKILAEKWRYRHTPNYYDNSMGIVPFNDSWIENPMHTLDKVGLYRINYKRKDNPLYKDVDIDTIFKDYRYWSTNYDEKVTTVN